MDGFFPTLPLLRIFFTKIIRGYMPLVYQSLNLEIYVDPSDIL